MRLSIFFPALACFSTLALACDSDEDCNLNGVCAEDGVCVCDPGWLESDCSRLDLRPVERWTGYNHTNVTMDHFYGDDGGNSSWGGHIIQGPRDDGLFHLIIAQFPFGCGLNAWKPFSVIIRAESRTGPRGPYTYAEDLFPAFAHNPTVIWSKIEEKYLFYWIGPEQTLPASCTSNAINNSIFASSSSDLHDWKEPVELIKGTNPAPFPLGKDPDDSTAMLLAVGGNGIYRAARWDGDFERQVRGPNLTAYPELKSEDPFLWQDKRGNWHMLVHHMIDVPTGARGPHVGAHLYSKSWEGPWTYNNITLPFNTIVEFTDGEVREYYRRERPKLFFSDDGNMTPLYLVTGVKETASGRKSHTLIQSIGDGAQEFEASLGF